MNPLPAKTEIPRIIRTMGIIGKLPVQPKSFAPLVASSGLGEGEFTKPRTNGSSLLRTKGVSVGVTLGLTDFVGIGVGVGVFVGDAVEFEVAVTVVVGVGDGVGLGVGDGARSEHLSLTLVGV